jgi:hypothetical protein
MIDTGKFPAYRMGRVIRLRRVDMERARFVLDMEREVGSQQYLAR